MPTLNKISIEILGLKNNQGYIIFYYFPKNLSLRSGRDVAYYRGLACICEPWVLYLDAKKKKKPK